VLRVSGGERDLSGMLRDDVADRRAEPSPDTIVVNGLTDRRLMCYKNPWGLGREKRRPSTLAGGHGDGL
jgi:hypothetical protein